MKNPFRPQPVWVRYTGVEATFNLQHELIVTDTTSIQPWTSLRLVLKDPYTNMQAIRCSTGLLTDARGHKFASKRGLPTGEFSVPLAREAFQVGRIVRELDFFGHGDPRYAPDDVELGERLAIIWQHPAYAANRDILDGSHRLLQTLFQIDHEQAVAEVKRLHEAQQALNYEIARSELRGLLMNECGTSADSKWWSDKWKPVRQALENHDSGALAEAQQRLITTVTALLESSSASR